MPNFCVWSGSIKYNRSFKIDIVQFNFFGGRINVREELAIAPKERFAVEVREACEWGRLGRIRKVHDAKDECCTERWGDVREEGEDEIKSLQRMVETGRVQGCNEERVQETRYWRGMLKIEKQGGSLIKEEE